MIQFDDKLAALAIAKAAETQLTPFAMCISWHDADGALAGGALFDGYNGASVHTHVAGFATGWCKPAWLYAVSDFCFNHLKVKRVIGIVSVHNLEALQFDLNFGFKPEFVIDEYFPTGAAQVLTLRREDCRFLGPAYKRAYDRLRDKHAAAHAA